jgi:hypothetical protein
VVHAPNHPPNEGAVGQGHEGAVRHAGRGRGVEKGPQFQFVAERRDQFGGDRLDARLEAAIHPLPKLQARNRVEVRVFSRAVLECDLTYI